MVIRYSLIGVYFSYIPLCSYMRVVLRMAATFVSSKKRAQTDLHPHHHPTRSKTVRAEILIFNRTQIPDTTKVILNTTTLRNLNTRTPMNWFVQTMGEPLIPLFHLSSHSLNCHCRSVACSIDHRCCTKVFTLLINSSFHLASFHLVHVHILSLTSCLTLDYHTLCNCCN